MRYPRKINFKAETCTCKMMSPYICVQIWTMFPCPTVRAYKSRTLGSILYLRHHTPVHLTYVVGLSFVFDMIFSAIVLHWAACYCTPWSYFLPVIFCSSSWTMCLFFVLYDGESNSCSAKLPSSFYFVLVLLIDVSLFCILWGVIKLMFEGMFLWGMLY